MDGALRLLQSNPSVVYAVPNSVIQASATPIYPNDPTSGQLWGLNNPNNIDVNAAEAWGITTGVSSTIVAVIDTGIDLTNPDFAGKIWTNPGNVADPAYPDAIHGWNFVSRNNNVQDDETEGHGTHVSAVIAAAGNDGYGVSGVDWNARIMPLKFLDSTGSGSTSDAISAIYFAVRHGARVINASWGGVENTPALRDAISYANSKNVIFVTAAGNDSSNNDIVANYPASYRLPNVLSVAAVDRNGKLAGFSNYGRNSVDVAAPGVDILSDVPSGVSADRLATLSGTSMSSAFVSGIAALLIGQRPSSTAAQIAGLIRTSAKPLPSLIGKTISGGMVDAYAALSASISTAKVAAPVAGLPILNPGSSTVADVRASLLASDEFFANQGRSGQGFVTGLYQQLLGRSPDIYGLQQWVGVYDSGTVTRFQLARVILASPEGRLTEVAHWFQDYLGRTTPLEVLKTDPGVAAWANLLVADIGDETTQASIMTSFEYLVGHGGTPETVIQGFYRDLHGRDPSLTERNAWAGLLYQGYSPFTVLRYFQGTPEASQVKIARWFIQDLGRSSSLASLIKDPGIVAFASTLGHF
ncbi:S8 family serine peptidase [Tundrisphaera lichenicola]|uniref:S8 family serine peptidase n=1 Tax=Tundrisphaera lichenicola TaxID=2029860 RepID=UPI003EB76A9F